MSDKLWDEVKNRMNDHSYMGEINRDEYRVKVTAEVFTPTDLVIRMIRECGTDEFVSGKTVLDPACGDGQFLSEVIIRKMERGSTFIEAISTTYGVEFMEDNVKECRARLAGPNPTQEVLDIVENNIVHHDALTYHYMFGEEKKRALF